MANDNASITAVNSVGIDRDKLMTLLQDVRDSAKNLSSDDAELVSDSLETIEAEAVLEHPKKGLLRTAVAGIKAVKGTAEFGAAVVALIQFFRKYSLKLKNNMVYSKNVGCFLPVA